VGRQKSSAALELWTGTSSRQIAIYNVSGTDREDEGKVKGTN